MLGISKDTPAAQKKFKAKYELPFPLLSDPEAEVIEAQVLGTSAMAGKAVRDAELPEAALIGLIQKGDKIVVPRGDTRLAEGDVLTIFAMRESVADVERLFQVGLDFF